MHVIKFFSLKFFLSTLLFMASLGKALEPSLIGKEIRSLNFIISSSLYFLFMACINLEEDRAFEGIFFKIVYV